MNTELLAATVSTMSEIQIEGVRDAIGFSNADKHIGAFLARTWEKTPDDQENIKAMAALVMKYKTQVTGMVGPEAFKEWANFAQGVKISMAQREEAKKTVLATMNDKTVAFQTYTYQPEYIDIFKKCGGRCTKENGEWKWYLPLMGALRAVQAIEATGAKVSGFEMPVITAISDIHAGVPATVDISSIDASRIIHVGDFEPLKWQITAYVNKDREIEVGFDYSRELVAAIKSLPSRQFQPQTKKWTVPVEDVHHLIAAFDAAGADVTPLQAIASTVKPPEPEPEIEIPQAQWDALRSHQKTAVKFLTRTDYEIRKGIAGGKTIKGILLGDDMGLGKTRSSIVSALSVAPAPEDTILVVCPAAVKLNWEREIRIVDPLADVVVLNGKSLELRHKWVIVNYDIVLKHYDVLETMGFAVLIIDESHYIKNRGAARTKLCVGGDLQLKEYVLLEQSLVKDPNDPKGKKWIVESEKELAVYAERDEAVAAKEILDEVRPREIKYKVKERPLVVANQIKHTRVRGLSKVATKRVFCLTGTPITNRQKDLLNQLRAIGSPLTHNNLAFLNTYCAPVWNGHGTTYDGATNVAQLRQHMSRYFIQRKKTDPEIKAESKLNDLTRAPMPVEIDYREYDAVMENYRERQRKGELKTTDHHLALLTKARQATAVAKIPATISFIENVLENNEKVIVFTNFTECFDRFMAEFKGKCVGISGADSNPKHRQSAEDSFNKDPNTTVFVCNIKAGGVGINLQAASQVVFNDFAWTPSDHSQAWSRAYRMGNEQLVNVTFMVAHDTDFDETMAELLEEKFKQIEEFEKSGKDAVLESLIPDLIKRLGEARFDAKRRAA